jgi:hypothetical protein
VRICGEVAASSSSRPTRVGGGSGAWSKAGGRRHRVPLPDGLLFIPFSSADGGADHLFPVASSSSPPARRTAVAVCGGGTAAASSSSRRRAPLPGSLLLVRRTVVVGRRRPAVGPTLWFLFFHSFEKLFAESLKILMAHHCREHELQLTA